MKTKLSLEQRTKLEKAAAYSPQHLFHAVEQMLDEATEASVKLDHEFHLVFSDCDCGDAGCYGKFDFKLFTSAQTARQEAQKRADRYGGNSGRPDMHIYRIKISTRTSDY